MMIQHFDLRDIRISDSHVTVRSARTADEAILLQWFKEEDAIGRCEVRVVDEFTIWPFIIEHADCEAGFAQAWMTTDGAGGLEICIAPDLRRRGLATSATTLLARHLRENLQWKRIAVEPHTDDAAAIACFTKAGFRDNGLRRDDGDHAHVILEWP